MHFEIKKHTTETVALQDFFRLKVVSLFIGVYNALYKNGGGGGGGGI
jgi:hypothetical protein